MAVKMIELVRFGMYLKAKSIGPVDVLDVESNRIPFYLFIFGLKL